MLLFLKLLIDLYERKQETKCDLPKKKNSQGKTGKNCDLAKMK